MLWSFTLLAVLSGTCASSFDFTVLHREYKEKCEHNSTTTTASGWSLSNMNLIHDFVRLSDKLRPCGNISEVVDTIQFPTAQYKCSIPWLSREEITEVMNGYSLVFWYGDSLTRHMTQALQILLRKDLQYGGLPPRPTHQPLSRRKLHLSKVRAPPPPPPKSAQSSSHKAYTRPAPKAKTPVNPLAIYEECGCDKQFAEVRLCGNYDRSFFSFTDITQVCPTCQTDLSVSVAKKHISGNSTPEHNTNMSSSHSDGSVKSVELFAQSKATNTIKTGFNNNNNSNSNNNNNGDYHHLSTEFVYAAEYADLFVKDTNYFVPGVRHAQLSPLQCMDDRDRPIFFSLQGGGHFKTDSSTFIRDYLSPFLSSIQRADEACYNQSVDSTANTGSSDRLVGSSVKRRRYNIKIVISGVPYVNKENENKFPHQSPEHSAIFYKGVEHYLAEHYPHISLLNIMALTKEGIGSSLDGYHSGTDVNLIKCMIMLNVMKLMLLETKPML